MGIREKIRSRIESTAWIYLDCNLRIRYKNPQAAACTARPNKIQVRWYKNRKNFGDGISPLLVKLLSGCRLTSGAPQKETVPRIFALGSYLQHAEGGEFVWGTGMRNDAKKLAHLKKRQLDVCAVRGPLTREYLLKEGFNCPEIYGDPSILMPYLFKPQAVKKYKAGIVRHYNDLSEVNGLDPNVRVISVHQDPLQAITEICQCETILSSSLHGIILAEAYGIPACWMRPAPNLWNPHGYDIEPVFKFKDYYASTGRSVAPFEYAGAIDIDAAIQTARRQAKPVFECEKLLLSFPFLREDIASLQDLVRYEIAGMDYPLSLKAWIRVFLK